MTADKKHELVDVLRANAAAAAADSRIILSLLRPNDLGDLIAASAAENAAQVAAALVEFSGAEGAISWLDQHVAVAPQLLRFRRVIEDHVRAASERFAGIDTAPKP